VIALLDESILRDLRWSTAYREKRVALALAGQDVEQPAVSTIEGFLEHEQALAIEEQVCLLGLGFGFCEQKNHTQVFKKTKKNEIIWNSKRILCLGCCCRVCCLCVGCSSYASPINLTNNPTSFSKGLDSASSLKPAVGWLYRVTAEEGVSLFKKPDATKKPVGGRAVVSV
jgi:hypothetical protein